MRAFKGRCVRTALAVKRPGGDVIRPTEGRDAAWRQARGRDKVKIWLGRPLAVGGLALVLAACTPQEFGRQAGPGTTSDERIASLRSQLASRPEDTRLLNDIGAEYARQGSWQQAAGAFREALIVDPRNAEALLGFSGAQSALGGYDVALAHAERAGGGLEALNLRGIALNGLGRRGEAIALFEAAFAAAPRDLDLRNNLALSLALGGRPEAYAVARGVAYAPEADVRHRRNFFLVAAILGLEGNAIVEGASLGVDAATVAEITAIGQRARAEGMGAFGVATL